MALGRVALPTKIPYLAAVKKSRIVTLFGEEELVPEDLQAAPKAPTGRLFAEGRPLPVDWDTWQPGKQYYAIGEVAALFGVRTSHIRFWTNEFNLRVRTTQKGDRLYNPQNIRALRNIYHLVKERGFTIPGARAKLKADAPVSGDVLALKQSLLQLRNQLLMIRNKLV
jgi:DNA-binding transcriptional MerR regulator